MSEDIVGFKNVLAALTCRKGNAVCEALHAKCLELRPDFEVRMAWPRLGPIDKLQVGPAHFTPARVTWFTLGSSERLSLPEECHGFVDITEPGELHCGYLMLLLTEALGKIDRR